MSAPLVDPFGRPILYLRISVTPVCNLRCNYCQPDGPLKAVSGDDLSPLEIERIASVFLRLGTRKIRITGGEPTLRKDLVEIVGRLAVLPGLEDLSLSTHGMFLAPLAAPLKAAGLMRVNVSLDTMNPERFARIAGKDALNEVLAGIRTAREAGLAPIKLNVVPQRGVNDDEMGELLAFAREQEAELRFIELMPLPPTQSYHEVRRLCGEELLSLLSAHGRWERQERRATDGPARRYRRAEDGMCVGIIDPLGPRFCENCNRVRLTARGELRNCLFGMENIPLRPCLARDDWESCLEETLRRAILDKPEKHRLELLDTGRLDSLVRVGG